MLQNAPFDAQDLMQRIANDLMDSYDEELELEIEDRNVDEAGDLVATDKLERTHIPEAPWWVVDRKSVV